MTVTMVFECIKLYLKWLKHFYYLCINLIPTSSGYETTIKTGHTRPDTTICHICNYLYSFSRCSFDVNYQYVDKKLRHKCNKHSLQGEYRVGGKNMNFTSGY